MIQDQKPEIDFLIDRIDCILSYLQSQGINNGPLANMTIVHEYCTHTYQAIILHNTTMKQNLK